MMGQPCDQSQILSVRVGAVSPCELEALLHRHLVYQTVPFPKSNTYPARRAPMKSARSLKKAAPQENILRLCELGRSVASSGAVVKGRSDWFAQCFRLVPLEETQPRTGSLLLLSAQSRRSSDEPCQGLQEAVRLGQGNEISAPPDDDWCAHQIFIRSPGSAGATFYPKHSRRFSRRNWRIILTR